MLAIPVAQHGHAALVHLLDAFGADLEEVDDVRGGPPLMHAANNGHSAAVHALVAVRPRARTRAGAGRAGPAPTPGSIRPRGLLRLVCHRCMHARARIYVVCAWEQDSARRDLAGRTLQTEAAAPLRLRLRSAPARCRVRRELQRRRAGPGRVCGGARADPPLARAQCGADPEATDFNGQTALMVAVFSGAPLRQRRVRFTGLQLQGGLQGVCRAARERRRRLRARCRRLRGRVTDAVPCAESFSPWLHRAACMLLAQPEHARGASRLSAC
jgi:hypothetical protein